MTDPWKLTRPQREALRKLAKVGCRKVVAYELGITEQALCARIKAARGRMKVRTDMLAVLEWDRWVRVE